MVAKDGRYYDSKKDEELDRENDVYLWKCTGIFIALVVIVVFAIWHS